MCTYFHILSDCWEQPIQENGTALRQRVVKQSFVLCNSEEELRDIAPDFTIDLAVIVILLLIIISEVPKPTPDSRRVYTAIYGTIT